MSMRIKVEGDWSGVVSFAMAGAGLVLVIIFGSQNTIYNKFLNGGELFLYIITGLYLVAVLLLGIMAYRGREVPDGSTATVWENTGFDFWGNVESAMCLWAMAIGFGMLLTAGKAGTLSIYWIIVVVVVLLIIAWGVTWLNFVARIMVFTPNKMVILMKGRPFTIIRKTFEPQDWLGLHITWKEGQRGGRFASSPANLYFIYGVYDGGMIKIDSLRIPQNTKRSVGLTMIHETVETTAIRVGLPVPPWPDDEDIYLKNT